jgi:two-component system sensor histidine kinase UhpB
VYGLVVLVAMGGLYLALQQAGFFHWLVANGALFAALWWLPRRWWPWLCAATIAARHVNGVLIALHTRDIVNGFLGYWPGPLQYLLGNVLEPFLVMAGVLVLRRLSLRPDGPMPPDRFISLLLGALVSGLMVAGKDLAYVISEGRVGDIRGSLRGDYVALGGSDDAAILGTFAISHVLGTSSRSCSSLHWCLGWPLASIGRARRASWALACNGCFPPWRCIW